MNIQLSGKKYLVHILIGALMSAYLVSANYLFDYVFKVDQEVKLYNIELPQETNHIDYRIDLIEPTKINWKDLIRIRGWAFVKGNSTKNDKRYIVLKSKENVYVFDTTLHLRYDLPITFRRVNLFLERAGFNAYLSNNVIKDGVYQIGLYIENASGKFLTYSNEFFTKQDNAFLKGFYSSTQKIDLPKESDTITSVLDVARITSKKDIATIEISGWAFDKGRTSTKNIISIVMKSTYKTYIFDTLPENRPDITKVFGKKTFNLDNSGFRAFIPENAIENGTYQIGICLKDGNRIVYAISDNRIIKNNRTIKLTS